MRPDQIEKHDFSTARRGFDRDEVRQLLVKLAGEVRGLEDALANQEKVARDLQLERSETPSSEAGTGEDPFAAFGDRLAVLLRQAHEVADETRESAEADAGSLRDEAQRELDEALAEAQRVRDEADAYRVQVYEDAERIREQAEIDGAARLDERRTQIEQTEAEIASERETAMAELSDARSQVATLLQEARAQSEFIKREAEEIIRTKVRASMEQAQKRIDVLRTTEESSKDRILTAQRELESALGRLEVEPRPEIPEGTEDVVLSEAEQRAMEAGPFTDSGRGYLATDGFVTEPDVAATDGPQTSHEVVEVTEAVGEHADTQDTDDTSDAVVAEEQPDSPADVDRSEHAVESMAPDADPVDGGDPPPAEDGTEIEGTTLVQPSAEPPLAPVADAENPLTEKSDADSSEDALARLVREAMQRAVETARGAGN